MSDQLVDWTAASPGPGLRDWVVGYSGSRLSGFESGTHRVLASAAVVVVVSLDEPIEIMGGVGSSSLMALGSCLRTSPGSIRHDGKAFDVAIELTPAGVEAILGVPARAIRDQIVDLDDLWGSEANALVERLACASTWRDRFRTLDAILSRRASDAERSPGILAHAWQQLLARQGRMSIADLADEVGYTRRHLHSRFTTEYGLTPKEAGRLMRFQHSARVLRRSETHHRRGDENGKASLAEVSVMCGFYDQSHMAREWNDLAGCPPSVWLAEEDLPFVQAIHAEEGRE